MGPTDSVPFTGLVPDQPPLALQLSASVAVQFSVVAPALATLLSAALNESVGAGVLTVTVTEVASLPPSPLHDKDSLPLRTLLPVQPPLALQLVALSADQFSVVEDPLSIFKLVALSETLGSAAITATATELLILPPGPLHESVNVVSTDMGPTLSLPVVLLVPDQPPLALQLSASVAVQFSVVSPALATLLSAALNESVGAGGAGGSVGVESGAGNTMTFTVCTLGRLLFDAGTHFRVNDLGASSGSVR
jgi:hypothetical protein